MNKKILKILVVSFFTLLSSACSVQPKSPTKFNYDYSHKLQLGNNVIFAEISKSKQQMELGLGHREQMAQDNGMIFDFGTDSAVSPNFWMKDMNFNLDLIWVYKNKIVGITADVPFKVKCQLLNVKCPLPTYSPPSPINWVVEVNAGWGQKNNLKVGDEVKILTSGS